MHEDDVIRGRSLPEPTLKLTLPSIHDNLTIDCRVYHPSSLTEGAKAAAWHRNAAIVAHPYAPLGGNYNDPIVDTVASTLLCLGFLVCTFNFRGASGSAGRTSWTAKAERADYMSVIGFVAHYVHFLDPFRRPGGLPNLSDEEDGDGDEEQRPILLHAGYSYGALMTTQLPSLQTILDIFRAPDSGSAAAEIRLRGEHLADTQNTILARVRAATSDTHVNKSPRKSMGVRVGGDEDIRKSRELPHRSFSMDAEEKFRDFVAKTKKCRQTRTVSSESVFQKKHTTTLPVKEAQQIDSASATDHLDIVPLMTQFRPAYLLISPLQGIITHLAAMSFSNLFGAKGANSRQAKAAANAARERAPLWAEAEAKLVNNSTLAIYGDQDAFVSAKAVRNWANRLAKPPTSQFRAQEVSTAGHFWTEGRVIYTMRDAVRKFAESLLLPHHRVVKLTLSEESMVTAV